MLRYWYTHDGCFHRTAHAQPCLALRNDNAISNPPPSLPQAEVEVERNAVERYLQLYSTSIPYEVGCHGSTFRLLQLSGAVPAAGPLDWVRSAWQLHTLLSFNPFLTEASCEKLQTAAQVRWQGVEIQVNMFPCRAGG